MRVLIWIGLAAALLGCGTGSENVSTGNGVLKVGIVYDEGGLNDKSFNDSAARGIQRAEDELGVEVVQIESNNKNDYESNLRLVAGKGCDIVFAIGMNMQSALSRVAEEFPDTKFGIVDAEVIAPNVRSLRFKEHEGSYLVGYLAGLMTKTGKIGFVGGEEGDLIKKFEIGYRAGAYKANPNIEFLPAKYTGSWNDIGKGRASANVLYGDGADIVYHAAGRAGQGVIRAAKANKKFAIGVDSDQDGLAEGFVLTSMIKRVDEAIFQTIEDLIDGSFSAEAKMYGLADGGVGVSEMKYTRDLIGEERLSKLDEIRQAVISGEIDVPSTEEEWLRTLFGRSI